MYHTKLWDEDKWNIHSKSYNAQKYSNVPSEERKEHKLYHEQKYGVQEKNENKSSEADFENFEEQKSNEEKEDDIQIKAAKQLFGEGKFKAKKSPEKKAFKTIEEAVKKAIEVEKKVIIMEN